MSYAYVSDYSLLWSFWKFFWQCCCKTTELIKNWCILFSIALLYDCWYAWFDLFLFVGVEFFWRLQTKINFNYCNVWSEVNVYFSFLTHYRSIHYFLSVFLLVARSDILSSRESSIHKTDRKARGLKWPTDTKDWLI